MSKRKSKLDNRPTLKNYFKNGTRPSEENFGSLIDSMINKVDDGISKNPNDGLLLAPEYEKSERALSFINRIGGEYPNWSVSLVQGEDPGLGIVQPKSKDNTKDETRLFFHKNGNIGVHNTSPKTDLEVDGILGMQSRVGTYKLATVVADGKWHTILDNQEGSNAYEVVAHVGKKGTGRHALLHATALSVFGQNRIRRTQTWFGWWWWDRLAIRWKGSQKGYKLQLKTRSDYGKSIEIKYYITCLWNNDIMSLFDSEDTN